jgi:Right handed beta helix region
MNKVKFISYVFIILLLTVITVSLLSNNSDIVRSQKQTVPFQPRGNIENKSENNNISLNYSGVSPTVEWAAKPTPATVVSDPASATPTPISDPSLPVFNVTTINYQCTTGDPSLAIQNAINSLPQNRTNPWNVTLQGVFNSVQNVILEDNINFIGQNATLIGVNNTNMFILNPNDTIFSEVHKVFNIDGYDGQFVDWVNLHNVTFQSLNFQHPLEPASGDYAIYCYQNNATGWGINDNFNIKNCTFNGFYSGFYGLPINSCFENNIFSNYTSNGFMLPYGLNVTIKNNTFDTPATNPQVLSYPGNYPTIGLHLLDVNVSTIVVNNLFITNEHSTGLAVVSSTGNITVSNNIFVGDGQPIAVDFYLRPFSTEGLYVYDNIGQPDFSVP